MFNTTNALVLREVRYKEADKVLTLFTSTDGKISVKARGAMRKSSKITAATQQLTYSEMTLFGNKDRWSVNEAVIKEPFEGLRTDLAAFSLGCYFAECVDAVSIEEQPDAELLQLILNSLYALSRNLYEPEHIKLAFEIRLMCLTGYEPNLSGCAVCGESCNDALFSMSNGCIFCDSCRSKAGGSAAFISADELAALRYIVSAPPKQIFSFRLNGSDERHLSSITEEYVAIHTERRFSTLDYWKKVK